MKISRNSYKLLAVLIMAIIAGCSQTPRFPWVKKWLEQPTCQPPCWENLYPGKTSTADVTSILGEVPEVIDAGESVYSGFVQCKSWSMIGCEKKEFGLACADKYEEKPISTIELKFTCNPGAYITLKDVINAYGTPSYVVPKVDNAGCHAYIFYIGKGIRLFVDGSSHGNMMKITANWDVLSVTLFQPERDFTTTLDSLGWSRYLDLTRMREWSGYTEYPCMAWK